MMKKIHDFFKKSSDFSLSSFFKNKSAFPKNIEFPSADETIVIYEQEQIRKMIFKDNPDAIQTALDLSNPQKVLFNYQKMMLSFLASYTQSEKMLLIGFGGGVLSKHLVDLELSSFLINLEKHPLMNHIAQTYFGYKTSEKNIVIEKEAFLFLKEYDKKDFDVIIIDAFDAHGLPSTFLVRDFYQQINKALVDKGVVILNTLYSSRCAQAQVSCLKEIFSYVFLIPPLHPYEGNAIIVASHQSLTIQPRLKSKEVELFFQKKDVDLILWHQHLEKFLTKNL